jgi:hypothetical protein
MTRLSPDLKRDTGYTVLALGAVAATSILGQIATYPNLTLGTRVSLNRLSIRQIGFLLRYGPRFMH